MSRLQASEMVQHGDQGLLWHLEHNHYPPLPATLLPFRAVCTGKKGKAHAPVSACVEAWHLDEWL